MLIDINMNLMNQSNSFKYFYYNYCKKKQIYCQILFSKYTCTIIFIGVQKYRMIG